jgi:hypothetical protein
MARKTQIQPKQATQTPAGGCGVYAITNYCDADLWRSNGEQAGLTACRKEAVS